MHNELNILFHDEHLVAINKPSGLLVHRSNIDKHETRFALQLLRDQLQQHIFPIHRLDKPTSGVLLFALAPSTAHKMCDIFAAHQLEKTYLAIVRGIAPHSALVDHPLSEEIDKYSNKKTSRRTSIKPPQEAITHFNTLAEIELPYAVEKYPTSRYSLVKCSPKTGRKHQIRRHLKHLNHPIIGDAKHGKSSHNHFFQTHFNIHRLLLAATELRFTHPITSQVITITAPLDNDMTQLINEFGWGHALTSGPANILNTQFSPHTLKS